MSDAMLMAKILKCFPKKWKISVDLLNRLNDTVGLIEEYNKEKEEN